MRLVRANEAKRLLTDISRPSQNDVGYLRMWVREKRTFMLRFQTDMSLLKNAHNCIISLEQCFQLLYKNTVNELLVYPLLVYPHHLLFTINMIVNLNVHVSRVFLSDYQRNQRMNQFIVFLRSFNINLHC